MDSQIAPRPRSRTRRFALGAFLAVLALGLAACKSAGGGGGAGGGEEGAATTVGVTLREFSVTPSPDAAPAGTVKFDVNNAGAEVHEFVVIKTDLAPDALPTGKDGAVDETGTGMEVIGEIEDIPAGSTQSTEFDLASGKYVLLCNITEEAKHKDAKHEEVESHYQEGMHATFTVT